MNQDLLRIVTLANVALHESMMIGMEVNACECWYDSDNMSVTFRFCDKDKPRRWPNGRSRWAFVHQDDMTADGAAAEVLVASDCLDWPIDQVREILQKALAGTRLNSVA